MQYILYYICVCVNYMDFLFNGVNSCLPYCWFHRVGLIPKKVFAVQTPHPDLYLQDSTTFCPAVQPQQLAHTHCGPRTSAYRWPGSLCALTSRLRTKQWWTAGLLHCYKRDSRCCPTQICMSCLPNVLQSLANHNSNSHIWMLFHLLLPLATAITFQGLLAGKVMTWCEKNKIKASFQLCQIHKNVLWICTK